MSNKRLIWADSLRGWLMLLVIFGHAIQSTIGEDCNNNHTWNLIYSFHMPAFMALSGWLAFRGKVDPSKCELKSFMSVCERRFFQLAVPYFVWSILQFIIRGNYSIQNLYSVIMFPDVYYWFLWVLFGICVLFNMAQLIAQNLNVNEMITIAAMSLSLLCAMVILEIRVLGFQFLAYYFLFYTIGYCFHKYENTVLLSSIRHSFVLLVLIILWAFLAWGWTMHGLPSWMPNIPHLPTTLLQYAYRGFTALICIVVLLAVSPKMLNSRSKVNDVVSSMGVVSLGLYVVHLTIMGPLVDAIKSTHSEVRSWLCIGLAFVIATALSYLVVWMLNKNKYTARIFLGKL